MLILSRKQSQSIMIGNQIQIKILKLNQDSVQIGINAPLSISVHRQEVYDRIRHAANDHRLAKKATR